MKCKFFFYFKLPPKFIYLYVFYCECVCVKKIPLNFIFWMFMVAIAWLFICSYYVVDGDGGVIGVDGFVYVNICMSVMLMV